MSALRRRTISRHYRRALAPEAPIEPTSLRYTPGSADPADPEAPHGTNSQKPLFHGSLWNVIGNNLFAHRPPRFNKLCGSFGLPLLRYCPNMNWKTLHLSDLGPSPISSATFLFGAASENVEAVLSPNSALVFLIDSAECPCK